MRARASVGTDRGAGVAEVLDALGTAAGPLRPMLARLDWAAALPNAAAPGFVYLAGALDGAAVGGGGAALAEAAGRLAGETAEALAQAGRPERCDLAGHPAIDRIWTDAPDCSRIRARDLADGRPLGVPATAVFPGPRLDAERRADSPPRSLGLAAGPDRAAALQAGILELVERDAAAGWWCGGARPRALDPGTLPDLAAEIARLRTGAAAPSRATTLLLLPSPTGLPVVAAVTREAAGRGLAVGLKAAPTPAAAARGAVLEALQMEIGLEMARHRATCDRATPGDRAALARAKLDPDALAAFAAAPALSAPTTAFAALEALVADLGRRGVALAAAELPLPVEGFAVAKVFSPDLRPMPGGPGAARPDAPGALAPLM